jgi:uncharacterized membrane protein
VHALEADQRLDAAVRVLEPVGAAAAQGPRGDVLRGTWLGHALHPLLTDLPLGCWLAAGLLDLTAPRRGRVAARRLIGLGLLAVPPTAASGLVDWSDSPDRRVQRVGVVHAVGNTGVALLYFGSWRARRADHHTLGVLLGLTGGLLAFGTGFLGGHLSFARGSGVAPLIDEPEGGAAPEPTGDVLLDELQAAAVLGVDPSRIAVMVEDSLLVTRGERDGSPLFSESDVMAARLVGG